MAPLGVFFFFFNKKKQHQRNQTDRKGEESKLGWGMWAMDIRRYRGQYRYSGIRKLESVLEIEALSVMTAAIQTYLAVFTSADANMWLLPRQVRRKRVVTSKIVQLASKMGIESDCGDASAGDELMLCWRTKL